MADNITLPAVGTVIATDDASGTHYQRVKISPDDSAGTDAFGRLRVSNPTTEFDSMLLNLDDAPLFWDESLESGAGITASTPTAAKPYIDFTSTDVTAGKFTRQTRRRFHYQPGKSHLVLMTGVLELASGTKTGCERRIGYFDDNNGVFFESDAGTIGVTIRSNDSGSPVDTTVAQASWNIDTLDGDADSANPSGATIDWTKAQIFVFDLQWLSVGRVRFGVEIAGVLYYVHQYSSANVTATPYMSTPNLPVRYQMITTASSGVCTMRCICSSVISEGGRDEGGMVRRTSTAGTGVTTDAENSIFAVLGIRLKSTHLHVTVNILSAQMQLHTTSEYVEWLLLVNPTVAGTFTYSGITNSALETATGATTNTITGGTEIAGGYLETGTTPTGGHSVDSVVETALRLGAQIDGTVDEIVLAVRPIGGVSAATVEGALVWREYP